MAVQTPNFQIASKQFAPDTRGLGAGIREAILGVRQGKAQAAQEAKDEAFRQEKQKMLGEGAIISSALNETDPEKRKQFIEVAAQKANPQFASELRELAEQPIEIQNNLIRAALIEDGLQELIPKAKQPTGKVGRFRSVDAGDRIQVFDSVTGDIVREVKKGTSEAKKLEQELKSEKTKEDIEAKKQATEAKKEEQKQKELNRIESTKGLVGQADDGLSLITQIRTHPGLSSAVGAKGISSLFGAFDEPIGGSDAAGVVALIETLESKNFLAGIKEFKAGGGAGSLSDNEGKKLGAAISNLKRSQSEKDFLRNLDTVERLLTKQRTQALSKLPEDQRSTEENKESTQAPPSVNNRGWQLMTDASGNQAYVGPNGEIEEVR